MFRFRRVPARVLPPYRSPLYPSNGQNSSPELYRTASGIALPASTEFMRNRQVAERCVDKTAGGWLNGFLGVLIFSGSLPATRAAVMDFDPVFLTVARATIAALLGIALLLALREKLPERGDVPSLVVVAIGVVIGYPLLSALALQHITSAHSIVFVGLLPLSTAIFGVVRGGERPRAAFWLFSCIGSALVVGYAVQQGLTASPTGDLLM